MGGQRHSYAARKRLQTSKIVGKLFYDPSQPKKGPKRRCIREHNKNKRKAQSFEEDNPNPTNLKLGSFNVRGLDHMAFWSVGELIKDREFDVRSHI